GLARLGHDPGGALGDFDHALALNPRSQAALQNKAHVLAERLNRTEEAVALLNELLALYPDLGAARCGRGVLLARLGHGDEARRDAEEALLHDSSPARLFQAACVYAQTSRSVADDRPRAFQLLATALRKGFGLDLLDKDHDLDPLRDQPEFRRLAE